MDQKMRSEEADPQAVRSHLGRMLKRAILLFLLLSAGVLVIAILTDGVPHLPFDYAGFD